MVLINQLQVNKRITRVLQDNWEIDIKEPEGPRIGHFEVNATIIDGLIDHWEISKNNPLRDM